MSDSYIDIGVGAVIEDDGGRLLFVRHKPERGGFWKGKWIFPGGLLEVGETVEDGIRREVLEETGLTIELTSDLVPPVERIVTRDGEVDLHVVYIVKRAKLSGGTLRPASDVGEAMWVERERITDIWDELHVDTIRILGLLGVSKD
jgi:ADP-ribose pyrophosphatase YjhB (NUDIX family)